MQKRGIVFDIQRFSIHDGPGIRTTVFMKGCPLRCLWCSNPESQGPTPQLLVRDAECVGCGRCVEACDEKAITMSEGGQRRINWELCTQCLRCVDACLYDALSISGASMDVETVVAEVERDRIFYRNSGGGITISGGEPLFQWGFVLELLTILKRSGLHTALDTSGYGSIDTLAEIVEYLDLVLFDIKHMDAEKHSEYTGVDNTEILENARIVSKIVPIWFRVPLIGGFNDSPEHMKRVGEMAAELGVEKVSLLPYHEGGKEKTVQIGREYRMNSARAPDKDRVTQLQEIITAMGIPATVGS